jgi:fatty acid desaturase
MGVFEMETRMAEKKTPKPTLGRDDVVVLAGLACLTAGAWASLGFAALVLPGAVLVWYALPTRPPDVSRQDR